MLPRTRDEAEAFLLGRINHEAMQAPRGLDGFKLQSMRQLLERLEHPERGLATIHIAGTKGKGSTALFISSILQQTGRRVGTYTSPHLHRIEERIAIDGQPIDAAAFATAVAEVAEKVAQVDAERTLDNCSFPPPTFFDIVTAAAWCAFRRAHVDVAVVEVGVGGRLDSTNLCCPDVTVITTIGLDHTRWLGDTTAQIAGEKAGIVKPGVPTITTVVDPEPWQVIRQKCLEHGAPLQSLGTDFGFELQDEGDFVTGRPARFTYQSNAPSILDPADDWTFELPLLGCHQALNAAGAIAAVRCFLHGREQLRPEVVRQSLAHAHFPGRIETTAWNPRIVFDVAHNVAAIESLLATLRMDRWNTGKTTAIVAISEDKNYGAMLAQIARAFDRLILTRFTSNARSVPTEELERALRAASPTPTPCEVIRVEDPSSAWKQAIGTASSGDLICVTGSTFLVAELRGRRPSEAGDP